MDGYIKINKEENRIPLNPHIWINNDFPISSRMVTVSRSANASTVTAMRKCDKLQSEKLAKGEKF